MDVFEPRVRRRGFFLHSSTDEVENGESENPEGFVVRIRIPRTTDRTLRSSAGRSARASSPAVDETRPAIRSGSVTGSRQRSHLPR